MGTIGRRLGQENWAPPKKNTHGHVAHGLSRTLEERHSSLNQREVEWNKLKTMGKSPLPGVHMFKPKKF